MNDRVHDALNNRKSLTYTGARVQAELPPPAPRKPRGGKSLMRGEMAIKQPQTGWKHYGLGIGVPMDS